MGFFFQKVGQAKREPKKAIVHPNEQRKKIAVKYGCAACPLNKAEIQSPKMGPSLPKETLVLFLGEAPNENEDNQGKPFTGPIGRLVKECIPNEFLDQCGFDNQINCHVDRSPLWNEVACCSSRRIKVIEEAQPKLIIGLGPVVCQWFLNSSDLGGMRGRFFAVKVGSHTCLFLPTYHPADILRNSYNKSRPLTSKFGHCFKLDLERAFARAGRSKSEGSLRPVIETEAEIRGDTQIFAGPLDFDDLIYILDKAKEAPVKAVDIETSALRPYANNAKILTVAISYDTKKNSYANVSFALDHPKSGWSHSQRREILFKLEALLKDDTIKISHNMPFEGEWFISLFGKEVIKHEVWECTQLQAHFLDERRGAGYGNDDESRRAAYQSLDFLCKMYFGTAYKSMFKLDKKNMAKADLNETLVYNAVDTKLTIRLYHLQTKLLKEAGLYDAYISSVARQPAIALMQHIGMDVDQNKVKELQWKLTHEIAEIENQILDLEVVKKYISDTKSFNPLGEDTLIIFRDYLKRKEIHVQDGKRLRLSTDKNVLEKIDHPLAKLIVALRNKTKMKSTYVDGNELGVGQLIWPDGKLHCHFNTTFTVTGRLSSDFPNLQNWPHRTDSWLREQIVAEQIKEGFAGKHYIVAADYGQLEACTAAMCSKDPVLVKALWEDTDVHMQWAGRLAVLCPDRVGGDFNSPSVAKSFRSLVKNKLVFPAIFGATNSSIAEYLTLDQRYIDELMVEFWDVFDGLRQWQDSVMKTYYKTGYTQSPTGRRRHYPMTRNEAINASIQGLASDIVCEAMTVLSYMAALEGKWYLHPRLNIHDDLTLVVPEDKIETAIETVYRVMLTPSFPCVNVPLSVEVSIGRDWFHMETLSKFWSHKDL